jgi:hypothetical protein
MSVCARCHRPLRSPEAIAAGIGPICARMNAGAISSGSRSMKVHFLSRRPEDGSRRWLVIDDAQYTVSIYAGGERKCECGSTDTDPCRHIEAALEHDGARGY